MTKEEAIEYLEDAKIKIKIPKAAVGARKTNEAIDMGIKALEQESCKDAISRQAVLDEAFEVDTKEYGRIEVVGVDAIAALSPITSKQKIGHWIFVDKAHEHAHCSKCDYGDVDLMDGRPHNYCPNCGIKMIEPQESEVEE